VLCGCGAKQTSKQISKGRWRLVFVLCCAVRVQCGQSKVWCWVKVLGSCAVRVPSKQAKVRCLVPVRVYPSKDKMVWFGAVLSAMVGCKVKVLG
jgi:hypothetical protein